MPWNETTLAPSARLRLSLVSVCVRHLRGSALAHDDAPWFLQADRCDARAERRQPTNGPG